MSESTDITPERIQRLHDWYRANVLDIPLTPEVQRRWFAFFKQGHNGRKLARVIRWLRIQIAQGKRNPGSLKISVLLDWDTDGVLMRFAEDHAMAQASFGNRLSPERRLAPLPEAEAPAMPAAKKTELPSTPTHQPVSDPAAAAAALANLRRFKETLR